METFSVGFDNHLCHGNSMSKGRELKTVGETMKQIKKYRIELPLWRKLSRRLLIFDRAEVRNGVE